jgi:hypothetical protein
MLHTISAVAPHFVHKFVHKLAALAEHVAALRGAEVSGIDITSATSR